MKVLTPEEMRAVDYRAIEEMGISSLQLMENAGRAVAEWVLDHLPEVDLTVVLAGRGNNGGDGLVAARYLAENNRPVEVILVRGGKSLSDDCQANLDGLPPQVPVTTIDDEDDLGEAVQHLKNWAAASGVSPIEGGGAFVDALLGTGVSGEISGLIADLLQAASGLNWPTVAVDIPSGIDGADGSYLGAAIPAAATVTMGLPKTGLFLKAGVEYSGEVIVADVGFPPEAVEPAVATMHTIEGAAVRRLFADDRSRPDEIALHKGDFGRILVVAGSRGMLGASELTARAALRAGCGMVVAAVPITEYPIVAARTGPEIMTAPVAAEQHFGCFSPEGLDDLDRWIKWADVLALGPGLSKNKPALEFARDLVTAFPDTPDHQVVVDADGLKAFIHNLQPLRDRVRAPIITPHAGEFAELTEPHSLPENLLDRLKAYADLSDCVIVLKGARTLVVNPQKRGASIAVNVESGNPGMATAGSGDVLTGILAGLAGQPTIAWDPFQIACTGVYLHGFAGDLAASRLSRQALIAGDIIDALPRAFRLFSRGGKVNARKYRMRRRR
jgi:NAD(P)H-hydrate epimerase